MCEEFIAYPEECLPHACRKLRNLVGEADLWTGDVGKQIVEMLEKTMTFSTHPVEVEHKAMKDELSSETCGTAHSHIGNRAAAWQYRTAFIAKGNTDPIGLRRPTTPSDVATAALATEGGGDGVAVPAQPPLQTPTPALGEPREAGLALHRSANLETQAIMGQLGGGNPKVMYINWQIRQEVHHQHATSNRKCSQNDIGNLRKRLAKAYDDSESTQKTWKALYQLVMTRRRSATPQHSRRAPAVPPKAHDGDDRCLWAGGKTEHPGPGQYQHLPMPPHVLKQHFGDHYKTLCALQKSSNDSSRYVMTDAGMPDRLSGFTWTGGPVYGCEGGALECLQAPAFRRSSRRLGSPTSCSVCSLRQVGQVRAHEVACELLLAWPG